ncbi:MAG: polysaccharide deacetylase family protein [Sphingomonas sp.]|uniref:polysaccharide deacetylase family protein n=1 Tax=Sphingomonas sp. TaxID=28214 RepID=UPI0025E347CD|nr:polysaccharide deacetylase family protein [Sphingomonas sp.]MBQ1500131.1 polysaccharide deacetylase family protein [Sphingomonas sp.]
MTGLRFVLKAMIACIALAMVVPGKRTISVIASTPPQAAKRIALSFDDVPRGRGAFLTPDERTARLVETFRSRHVPQPVFFLNPNRIVHFGDGIDAPKRIAAYVAAGGVLANHTNTHPKLSKVAADIFLADIDRAEAYLKTQGKAYRPWLRFPYLDEGGPDKAKRDAVRAGLAARGMMNGYATIDGSDWNMEGQAIAARKAGKAIDMDALRDLYVETHVRSADFGDELARRALGRSPAHVLLLHETDMAGLFLGDLIDALRQDGWEIIGADEAYADPMHRERPDVAWTAGTMIEQLAWEKKLAKPRWYERNDVKVANALFAERVLHEKLGAGK